jgi:hypothetical protein
LADQVVEVAQPLLDRQKSHREEESDHYRDERGYAPDSTSGLLIVAHLRARS